MVYFKYNASVYLQRNGVEKTKNKIKFMHKKISNNAKKLVDNIKFKDQGIIELIQKFKE
jgi:hypothetical protein